MTGREYVVKHGWIPDIAPSPEYKEAVDAIIEAYNAGFNAGQESMLGDIDDPIEIPTVGKVKLNNRTTKCMFCGHNFSF